jgi:hypothetical protein
MNLPIFFLKNSMGISVAEMHRRVRLLWRTAPCICIALLVSATHMSSTRGRLYNALRVRTIPLQEVADSDAVISDELSANFFVNCPLSAACAQYGYQHFSSFPLSFRLLAIY